MYTEVRTDNHIENSTSLLEHVRKQLNNKLSHYSEKITHAEVHFSDENAEKGGDLDKRCAIEARVAGLKPLGVSHKAPSVELALDGAIERLKHMLSHQMDKRSDHHRQTRPDWTALAPE